MHFAASAAGCGTAPACPVDEDGLPHLPVCYWTQHWSVDAWSTFIGILPWILVHFFCTFDLQGGMHFPDSHSFDIRVWTGRRPGYAARRRRGKRLR
jgi:hypothetical protein